MARAKRHYVPDQIWHITQRCHKREFLLKFKRDRHRWIQWLFEAKRRFGLVVLNYVVTSNHYPLNLERRQHSKDHPAGCRAGSRKNRTGIQPAKTPEWGILGGSIPFNRHRNRRAFVAVFGIHRFEYGPCRCYRPSVKMATRWL